MGDPRCTNLLPDGVCTGFTYGSYTRPECCAPCGGDAPRPYVPPPCARCDPCHQCSDNPIIYPGTYQLRSNISGAGIASQNSIVPLEGTAATPEVKTRPARLYGVAISRVDGLTTAAITENTPVRITYQYDSTPLIWERTSDGNVFYMLWGVGPYDDAQTQWLLRSVVPGTDVLTSPKGECTDVYLVPYYTPAPELINYVATTDMPIPAPLTYAYPLEKNAVFWMTPDTLQVFRQVLQISWRLTQV